ncbi:TspO/MBR family protein [Sphingomonas sp. 1P06PA]|uniref:TspO/MBR family protein n=1 Tax=Sphingomonas sp. 1P06PA TaxID=554121 RepID=UPI0039A74059
MTRLGTAWLMPMLVAAALAAMVAVMGATITDLGPWYRSLAQPAWAPPDAAYGIAWTLIYASVTVAAVSAWSATDSAHEADWLFGMFALNGFLNIVWSLLFFRFHRPDWALVEGVALWLSVAALVILCGRRSRLALALLLPYLAWVGVALALNLAVVRLNGPFG